MATPDQKFRAGRAIRQPEGYSAFIPAPLPPIPPLRFDSQLATVLAGAGTALGRLDGVAATLPNPELFVAMYVRREAVLSSQIEGTQSTLDDVLAYEIDCRLMDAAELGNRGWDHPIYSLPAAALAVRMCPATAGYIDEGEWEEIVDVVSKPIVARELLEGRYEAGLTHLEYADRYPEQLRVDQEIGEIDTTWIVIQT